MTEKHVNSPKNQSAETLKNETLRRWEAERGPAELILNSEVMSWLDNWGLARQFEFKG